MDQLGSHWTDFHENLIFQDISKKSFSLEFGKNEGIFCIKTCADFKKIFRYIILRMKNVSGKIIDK